VSVKSRSCNFCGVLTTYQKKREGKKNGMRIIIKSNPTKSQRGHQLLLNRNFLLVCLPMVYITTSLFVHLSISLFIIAINFYFVFSFLQLSSSIFTTILKLHLKRSTGLTISLPFLKHRHINTPLSHNPFFLTYKESSSTFINREKLYKNTINCNM